MSSSRRQTILERLRDRCGAIAIADGFETNAGEHVFLGEAHGFGPDDPPIAIVVVVGEETPKYTGENIAIDLPIVFQALASADLDEPWIAVEQLLSDIKRAVELPDRTLG